MCMLVFLKDFSTMNSFCVTKQLLRMNQKIFCFPEKNMNLVKRMREIDYKKMVDKYLINFPLISLMKILSTIRMWYWQLKRHKNYSKDITEIHMILKMRVLAVVVGYTYMLHILIYVWHHAYLTIWEKCS